MNNPQAAIRTPGDLIRRYSYQFQRSIDLTFHKGWFDIFVQLCADVDAVLHENRYGFFWVQIKEKFGTARFHYMLDFFGDDLEDRTEEQTRAAKAIFDLVEAAKSLTAQRCIVCGTPGTLNQDGGHLLTLCDFHAQLRLNGGRLGQFSFRNDDLEQDLR